MAELTQEVLDFCREAYSLLKDDPSPRACHIKYRNNEEKYITYIMQKESWYYGKWVVFEGNVKMMTVDEKLLIQWDEERESKKKGHLSPLL